MNVGSVRDVVLRDRRHLASDGVLIVVATIAADTAEPIAEPEIIARGFIEPSDDGNELLDQARDTVERVLAECQAHRTTEVHLVQQELHDALAELVSHDDRQAADGPARGRRSLTPLLSPDAVERLRAHAKARIAAGDMPGVAVAVTGMDGAESVLVVGHADLAGTPLRSDHLLQIGSISKSFAVDLRAPARG